MVGRGDVMRQCGAWQCNKAGQGNEAGAMRKGNEEGRDDVQREKIICHHGVV